MRQKKEACFLTYICDIRTVTPTDAIHWILEYQSLKRRGDIPNLVSDQQGSFYFFSLRTRSLPDTYSTYNIFVTRYVHEANK